MQSELVQIIREHIRAHGPQSFAWFMEQALYHPRHGHYSSGRATIGRKGDFFTNVSVGPLFGRLLAAQFVEIWERLDRVNNFTIVEQGAHDGQFGADVLNAVRSDSPEFFEALRYRIIEPFAIWQDRQSQTLKAFHEKVEWSESTKPFAGVHFSNELLDALPFNLRDKLVSLNGDDFVLVEGNSDIESSVSRWVNELAVNLQRGFALAIDYGFTGNRFREMVQTRAGHRLLDSPFHEIGNADITRHVNWTEIMERAKKEGLDVLGFTDQHHFLTGIISKWPELIADEKSKRALQTLLHPEMLGRAFQVILLGKDVDPAESLAGFRFARRQNVDLESRI